MSAFPQFNWQLHARIGFSLLGAPLLHIPCVTFIFVINSLHIIMNANGALRIVASCRAMPCPHPRRDARLFIESIIIDYFATSHSPRPQSRRSYYMRLPDDIARLRTAIFFVVTITASTAQALAPARFPALTSSAIALLRHRPPVRAARVAVPSSTMSVLSVSSSSSSSIQSGSSSSTAIVVDDDGEGTDSEQS